MTGGLAVLIMSPWMEDRRLRWNRQIDKKTVGLLFSAEQQLTDELNGLNYAFLTKAPLLASLTSRMEGWKDFSDEICVFPSCFRDWKIRPVNQPLYHRLIVPWNQPSLQYINRSYFDVAWSIYQKQVRCWDCFWTNVSLQLADMKDIM